MNIWTSKAGSQQGEAVGEELCVPLVMGPKNGSRYKYSIICGVSEIKKAKSHQLWHSWQHQD
jgi:hypothetical protein